MKKHLLFVLLLLFANLVFAAKLCDLKDIYKPDAILVDGNDIIIVERTTFSIHVYSKDTFKLKYKLGSRGEGPGQYKRKPRVRLITPDFLMASGGNKNIWYTREGKMQKEMTIPKAKARRLTPLTKGNYVALAIDFNLAERIVTKSIYLLNSKFEQVKPIYSALSDSNMRLKRDTGSEEYKMITNYLSFIYYDSKIFIADSRKGFFIAVFDEEGNPLYSIDKNKEVEKVKVTAAYKKKVMDVFKIIEKNTYEWRTKSAFTFYDNFPPIRYFMIDSNKIYVLTDNRKNGMNEIITLDLKGKILDRVFTSLESLITFKRLGRIDPFTIHKGEIYELIDNPDTETMELHKKLLPINNK